MVFHLCGLTGGASGVVFLDLARNEIGPQGLELMCGALVPRPISGWISG